MAGRNLPVEHVFHLGVLDAGVLRVLHDLGVVARVDHHANHPLGVLESRAAQDELIVVEVDQLLLQVLNGGADWTEGAFKAVEQVVGRVTHDVALQAAQLARSEALQHGHRLLLLEVGLSV